MYNLAASNGYRIGGCVPKTKTVQSSWDKKNIFFFVILPLLIGLILAAFIPQPQIGTITLTNTIDDYETELVVNQIRLAENRSEIRAVVIILDCPGGTISGTELIYLEMLKLRQTKPVVTMIQ